MSYILSALRKAEKERKGGSQADADQWDAADWNSPATSSRTTWVFKLTVAVATLLLAAVVILLWLLMHPLSESTDIESDIPSNDQVETIQLNTPVAGPVQLEIEEVPDSPSPELLQLSVSVEDFVGDPELPTITGHLYFPANESLSRLFGETGSYREGHVFQNGLTLKSISQTQAVFEYKGQMYELYLDN